MKKLFGLMILLSFSLISFSIKSANAQHVTQGSMMIGGGFSFTSQENDNGKNTTVFGLSPNLAYFVANNFALGMEVNYSRFKSENYTSNVIGISPLVRGYIAGGLFGQAQYF